MKKVLLTVFTLLMMSSNILCAGELAVNITAAMKEIGRLQGDENMLVLTDAPYVKIDGSSALPLLQGVQKLTGCTVGKGNLLFFQRPQNHPLRFMLMNKTDGKAVIISKEGNDWLNESVQLDRQTLSSQAFWDASKELSAAGDIFALAGIGGAWAMDAPYDYLKVAELHNHLCPGVTSGYLLANYIQKHFTLHKGEKYTVISSPVWCKEDALQVMLDCTPGKRGMVVKPLAEDVVKQISFANPAGMILVWNAKKKTGKGYALTFDFNILKGYAPEKSPKVAVVLAGLEHIENSDQFITTAASFDLDEETYNKITRADSNPYQVVGLMN